MGKQFDISPISLLMLTIYIEHSIGSIMLHRLKKLRASKQLFFTLLIAFSVIAVWRGLKGLMDLYLFSDNPVLSYCASLSIGLFILYITHYWTKELA